MKPLLLIAAFYAAVNAVVIGGIGLTVGWPPKELVTVFRPDGPNGPDEQMALRALLEITTFSEATQPQLFVLGASGAAHGFPPSLVQDSLPGFVPSTIATGGATVTELRRLLDEIVWATQPAVLRRSVLVLGMSYAMFCPDAQRYKTNLSTPAAWWQQPHITTYTEKAVRRHPLILDRANPVRRMLPRGLVLAATRRFRIWGRLSDHVPLHPGEWLAQRGRWRFQTRSMQQAREEREARVPRPKPILEWFLGLSVEEQVDWFTGEHRRMGEIVDDVQFDRFAALLDHAASTGLTVVVVDLPLHSEHRRHAPVFESFRQRLRELVASQSGGGRVHYLDLTDSLPDENFIDLAHANKERVDAWVDLLVDRLRPLLPDQSPRSRE